VEKASALGFALIKNHPFLDGNKRIGHAAMEVFLVLNGFEISAPVEEQEQIILQVASSAISPAMNLLSGCAVILFLILFDKLWI
jgi:death-on-curing protein